MTAITTAVRLLREAATELKKSHTLNGDWGNEHDALTAYNAHIAAAADLERIAPQCLAQIEEPAQPVCWIRFCSDGSTEGPIMHSQICEARKTSGAWTPLYAGAAPAAVAGPADMRNALRWAAGGLRAVADDNDTLRIGSETRTVGEVLDAANAALEPAAPALEAPAAPVSTYVEVRECSDCGHVGINDTDGSKAACNTCDWQGDSPREDKCPGCNRVGTMSTACPKCGSRTSLLAETHLLAAAPQAPAAPVELPEPAVWTLQSELDAKRTTTSGHLWFTNPVNCLWTGLYTAQQLHALLSAAPAAPAVDAPKELDPGLSREVYRACEDLPEGWSIRIDLENGYGSVTLIDPDGEENELPVDGWLSDAMRASIAAAQAKEGGA